MKELLRVLSLLGIVTTASVSLAQEPLGAIRGKVLDAENMQPLTGVNVFIPDLRVGCSTDAEGNYEIPKVKVGSFSIVYSYIGSEKVVNTDVIVRSGRTTYVNVEMKRSSVSMQGVEVTAGYFNQTEVQHVSAVSFSSEEIRRSPGAGGDVSRVISGLPSLAKINDTKNSLIVRGGSAVENGFYVDNIEIPNINHFPVQGSTEGPIGIINIDLVENVNFYSGGFSSLYGDRLSSVMDLKFREGDRNSYEVQLDMSMQGFGGVVEGPINGGNGSFVLSARRSYLDLILDLMNEKVGLPVYSDAQAKVVYDLDGDNKMTLIDVFSIDGQKMNQADALENKNDVFIDYAYYSNTAGLNWRHLWGKTGYSNTSVSHTYSKTNAKYFQTRDAKFLFDNNSLEEEYRLRNTNHLFLSNELKIEFGIDAKGFVNNYNQFYNDYQDMFGQPIPSLLLSKGLDTYKLGVFAGLEWEPFSKLTIKPGLRFDYYSYNKAADISPRFSTTYEIDKVTSLTGTAGIYYQNIPWVIAAQKDEFRKLSNPKSYHYIIGLERLLTESTKLTVEIYDKDSRNFPMDPMQQSLFLFDQAVVEHVFMAHPTLVSTGEANSKGIEVTVQKKLAKDFYGLVASSYSKARYKGLDNKWYDRLYDNRFTFAAEGGYKPDEKWEFSLRWIYAGGAPYTPFDEEASRAAFKGIFDETRVNGARLPDFHSLNIRADRRFNFQSSALVVYLSVWNAYARQNIATYYWSEIDNEVAAEKMWGILPVFGIEYEF